jgi:hypothetical protein
VGLRHCLRHRYRFASRKEENIMRRIAMAMLLLASTAHAQTLYKCVSKGVTSYQQTPCPLGSWTVRSFQTVPEPPPTPAQRAEQRRQAQQDRVESAFLSHLAGTDQPRSPRVSRDRSPSRMATGDKPKGACDSAKRSREHTLRAVGLDRNIDLSRRLDDDVAEACRR